MNNRTGLALVVALFLLAAVMNYSIHYNYPLPLHSDEYDHLAVLHEMQQTGKHVWYDPYIVQKRPAQRNLEINYDIFLYVFGTLTGLQPEHLPLVLPALFSFMLSLSAFVLVFALTKRDLAAFFAGIFVFFLPSNIAFLGYWFLVPMAVGIAAVPILAHAFLKAFNSWSYTLTLYVLIISITFTHVVYITSLLPAFLAFILLSPAEFKNRKNLLKLALGTLLLLGLTVFFVKWNQANPLETILVILNLLVWPYGNHTAEYPLASYLGPTLAFLALAGALYFLLPLLNRALGGLVNRLPLFHSARKTVHYSKFVPLFAVVLLAVRVYADYSGTCLLGPCRRTVPALVTGTLILAAVGFYAFIGFLNKLLLGVSPKPYRVMRAAIFMLVLAFLFHQLLTHPFVFANDPVRGLYHNIETTELPALSWIKEFTEPDTVVFALPWTAKAIYLLADRKVVDTGAARLGTSLATLKDLTNFFLMDCAAKEAVLAKWPNQMIYAGKGYVDCPNLDQVLNSGGNFAYVQNT